MNYSHSLLICTNIVSTTDIVVRSIPCQALQMYIINYYCRKNVSLRSILHSLTNCWVSGWKGSDETTRSEQRAGGSIHANSTSYTSAHDKKQYISTHPTDTLLLTSLCYMQPCQGFVGWASESESCWGVLSVCGILFGKYNCCLSSHYIFRCDDYHYPFWLLRLAHHRIILWLARRSEYWVHY